MHKAIGIDAGSATTKIVAVDADGAMMAWRLEPSAPLIEDQTTSMIADMLDEIEEVGSVAVAATGYGRKLVTQADKTITEITCHARGVFEALQQTGTLIDIGGQDSKVIRIGPKGKTIDFVMNDKCAAGTGRFLEHTAARLQIPLAQLGARVLAAKGEETISNTCTVFAESEIISQLAHGADVDNILKGLHRALAQRIAGMVKTIGIHPPMMLSGGVAQNTGLRKLLADALGEPIQLPEQPQLMGAYGAALLALKLQPGDQIQA